MGFLSIIGYLFVGSICGFIVGIFGANIFKRIHDLKVQKGLKDMVEGKRKNEFELDGKKIDVHRFIVPGDDGKDIIIDIKDKDIKEKINLEEENKSFMNKFLLKTILKNR